MRPINFPEANAKLEKPDSLTDEQCGPIDVCFAVDPEGTPLAIVCWEPTPDEWLRMRQRGHIYLSFIGHTIIPHVIYADSPFIDPSDPENN